MDLVWVIKEDYISGYRIKFTFNDGISGIIEFKDKFSLPIYKPLKDKEYFKTFKLNSWTVEWENGADFAPEFLYGLINKHTTKQANKTYA